MITLPRVAARIFGEPLAISREKLDVIVAAVGPRLQGMPMDDPDVTAGRSDYQVCNGIALIDISGTLVSKASGMDAMSGLTSYADIAADFSAAIDNPMVNGVALLFDTPGGEVKGMFETGDLIFKARGKKPIISVVECAASAGYALASAADQVIVSRTGITGSIGVIAMHLDVSGADEKAGLKYTSVYAGDRKNDGNPHNPLSPEARTEMQARIDQVYEMFVSAVARNRGMDAAMVRKTQAAVFMGQDGVSSGLADAVGSMDDAAGLLASAFKSGSKSLYANSHEVERMAEVNVAPPEAKVPTAAEIEALVAAAREAGLAEAGVIADLCAIAGMPGKAAGFIGEKKSADQVRKELLAAKVDSQKGTELSTSVMPGADAKVPDETQGKAKPWGDVLKALGIGKKEAR
jgi:signal peptide peptidase SppA